MKRKLIAFLLVLFTALSISGTKAYCSDTQTISFSNIKSIMIENSIDMKIADNNLKNTKQELQKINDSIEDLGYKGSTISKNISTLEDDIEKLDSTVKSLKKQLDSMTEGDPSYSEVKSEYEDNNEKLTDKQSTLKQLKNYKDSRTAAQRNLKKAELTYDKTVEDAVYKAQQSYVSCLSTTSQLENKKNTLEYNTKKSDISKLQYESGFLSKKDYEDTITNNTDSENEIKELESKNEIALNNLKLTLGISQGVDVNLDNNVEVDFNSVMSINYNEDLKEMLKNSIDISASNLEVDWAKDDDDNEKDDNEDHDYENYTLENKELSLDKQSTTSEINFKEKYNNLMTAYNSIKSSYDKLQQSQEDYGVSSKKYSLGFITKNELEKAKLDLDSTMSDFNSERNDFYLKYLDYTQMKEGY